MLYASLSDLEKGLVVLQKQLSCVSNSLSQPIRGTHRVIELQKLEKILEENLAWLLYDIEHAVLDIKVKAMQEKRKRSQHYADLTAAALKRKTEREGVARNSTESHVQNLAEQ